MDSHRTKRYELKAGASGHLVLTFKELLYSLVQVQCAVPEVNRSERRPYRSHDYDATAEKAVTAFQKLEGLIITGTVTPETWKRLGERCGTRKIEHYTRYDPELASLVRGTTQASARGGDPNCMLNAVEGATGLARVFGNVRPGGTYVGHDGVHVVAPIGSKLKTLPVLAGKVIDRHDQGDGTSALDVLVNGGKYVVIYKDIKVSPAILRSLQRKQPHTLKTGDVIGIVASGGEKMGVHITLLRGGQREHDYYRGLTRRVYALAEARGKAMDKVYANKANPTLEAKYREEAERLGREKFDTENKIKAELFVDPLSSKSPIKCPGAEADPAAVIPYRK